LQCPPPFNHNGSYFSLDNSCNCFPCDQSTTSSDVPCRWIPALDQMKIYKGISADFPNSSRCKCNIWRLHHHKSPTSESGYEDTLDFCWPPFKTNSPWSHSKHHEKTMLNSKMHCQIVFTVRPPTERLQNIGATALIRKWNNDG
jgi:hypothetical protein